MKYLIASSLLAATHFSSPAHASWRMQLRCEGLVVDVDSSLEGRGWAPNQIVVRDSGAVNHLRSVRAANEKGELIWESVTWSAGRQSFYGQSPDSGSIELHDNGGGVFVLIAIPPHGMPVTWAFRSCSVY